MPTPPLLASNSRTGRIIHHPLHLLERDIQQLGATLGRRLHLYRAAGGVRCGIFSRRVQSRVGVQGRSGSGSGVGVEGRGSVATGSLLLGGLSTSLVFCCCALLLLEGGGGEVVAGSGEAHFFGDEEEEDGYEEEF